MAIVKSEYKVLNSVTGQYDTHYLKTSVDQVEGLSAMVDTENKTVTVDKIVTSTGIEIY